jgi:hypothetical protein
MSSNEDHRVLVYRTGARTLKATLMLRELPIVDSEIRRLEYADRWTRT